MANVANYKNIELFLNFRAFGANAVAGKISSVDARQTSSGEFVRFEAPLFVDCTGDGWIGYWAGAEYNYGREASSNTMKPGKSAECFGAPKQLIIL